MTPFLLTVNIKKVQCFEKKNGGLSEPWRSGMIQQNLNPGERP